MAFRSRNAFRSFRKLLSRNVPWVLYGYVITLPTHFFSSFYVTRDVPRGLCLLLCPPKDAPQPTPAIVPLRTLDMLDELPDELPQC